MTPMSWVNIALASCVTMCLQSYFSNYQEIEELAIQVDSSYEEGHFKLVFLDTYCRSKNLFREDIDVDISLVK